jgi:dTDP-L-rhamnose 4-epimerase
VARVLITGGAGFVGSHTADALLAAGHEVRVLDILHPQVHGAERRRPDYLDESIELVVGDVRDTELAVSVLDGVDAVFHLAAETGVGQSMAEIERYVDVNVSGTAALWEAIRRAKERPERLVLASSRAVYGEGAYDCSNCGRVHPGARDAASLAAGEWRPHCPRCRRPTQPAPTPESSPRLPVSVYGLTKQLQEDVCTFMATAIGVGLVVLRYFNVFGERQSLANPYTGLLATFATRLSAGKPVTLYENGEPVRDFVHVTDVAAANLLALDVPVENESVFNVGSGRGIALSELVTRLEAACGAESAVEARPRYRIGDIFASLADLEQARRTLGFEPRILLDEGLALFAAWLREQAPSLDRSEAVEDELIGLGLLHDAQTRG